MNMMGIEYCVALRCINGEEDISLNHIWSFRLQIEIISVSIAYRWKDNSALEVHTPTPAHTRQHSRGDEEEEEEVPGRIAHVNEVDAMGCDVLDAAQRGAKKKDLRKERKEPNQHYQVVHLSNTNRLRNEKRRKNDEKRRR